MENPGKNVTEDEVPNANAIKSHRSPRGKNGPVENKGNACASNANVAINLPETTTAILNTGILDRRLSITDTEEPFDNLESKVQALVGIMNSQRHINQTMKDLVASISQEIKKAIAKYRSPGLSRTTVDAQTQCGNNEVKKRLVEKAKTVKNQLHQMSAPSSLPIVNITNSESQPKINDIRKTTWTKVTRNKSKEAPANVREKSTRPEAIIVQKKGEASYADMLKMLKSNSELADLGSTVNKIRRTAKGELMLILKRGPEVDANKHKGNIAEVLHDFADIHVVSQQTTIECRDLDETTTVSDVCTAIRSQFPSIESMKPEAVKVIRPSRYGTQNARIVLPTRDAKILINAGRIRIGWVVCRIREFLQPTRCYKCLEFGHVSKYCKNDTNRAGACFRCGNTGHKAKSCDKTPRCLLCPADNNNHDMLNKICPVYQAACRKLHIHG
ncbi:uncharacterized protein LOC119663952 [Teleopsis dalmanni]|uniref:uncharacterized protein LOC119663952 n=1 Tax=Teleopsis dalmanni TaxID=139649 RepID=UPI0018CEDA84|nr:uncharacterized protein LOC119663952 [Teleopsis dalmanni]